MNATELKQRLVSAYAEKASDVLITAGSPIALRVDGTIRCGEGDRLDADTSRELVYSLLSESQIARFEQTRELDFSLTVDGHRFRGNAYWQANSVAAALRLIPDEIPRPEKLGLPTTIIDFLHKPQGLLLVTGASDQGKTTTQASMVDYINRTTAKHIITIEDPVEFVHANKQSIVDQRELGIDTLSFAEALRHTLRQSPDVILLGEMRDPETIRAALTAAETGHLVISTLHTNDACQALDRIIDVFPEYQIDQIRAQLSLSLLAVIAQRLVRSVHGRLVLAVEILSNNRATSNLIREGKTQMLYNVMETSRQHGMQTMNRALETLVEKHVIPRSEAQKYWNEFESSKLASTAG